MPRVSVVIPAYNHEKFVGETIESVLNQTYQDFELLITDDGSTDGTVKVIRTFTDNRIEFFQNEKNIGAVIGTNRMIQRARGEYIAILSSDDVFMPDKLEKQVRFLDEHSEIAAVFSHAMIIDEDGNALKDSDSPQGAVFCQANRNRFEWLNYFFYNGNCLCHPSLLIRKECYEMVGRYDPRMAQIPDLDFWIRLCMMYEIHILPEELVRFRVRDYGLNASGTRAEVGVRTHYEKKQVLGNYLKIRTISELLAIFPETKELFSVLDDCLINFYIARLALSIKGYAQQLFALDVLFESMGRSSEAERIKRTHGYSYLDLIRETGTYDIHGRYKNADSVLLVDVGRRGSKQERVAVRTNPYSPSFSVVFDLSRFSSVRSVRWDPIRRFFTAVRIERVLFRETGGGAKILDLRLVRSKGRKCADGYIGFDYSYPRFCLPISGKIDSIEILGKWQIEDYDRAVAELLIQKKYSDFLGLTWIPLGLRKLVRIIKNLMAYVNIKQGTYKHGL